MGQESQWVRGTIIRQGNYCSNFQFVHNMTTTMQNLSEGLRLEQLSRQSGLRVKALKNKKLYYIQSAENKLHQITAQ